MKLRKGLIVLSGEADVGPAQTVARFLIGALDYGDKVILTYDSPQIAETALRTHRVSDPDYTEEEQGDAPIHSGTKLAWNIETAKIKYEITRRGPLLQEFQHIIGVFFPKKTIRNNYFWNDSSCCRCC